MVSHKYKCIFVHIPKAAGTSIGSKLGIYDESSGRSMQDHRTIKQVTPVTLPFLTKAYKKEHAYALYRQLRDRLERRPFVTQEQFDSYFKFTFVRNPWARVHSWYKNILNDPVHMKTFTMPQESDLHWFVKNRLYTVESQLDFIRGWDGEIAMDFIGRYEHLHEDFAFVCQVLGIEDSRLPEKMMIGTPSYIPAYDEESVEIVSKAFKEEIDIFGFNFGDRLENKGSISLGSDLRTTLPVADNEAVSARVIN